MITPELVTYIQTQLDAGAPKERIQTALLQKGWQLTDIESAFQQISETRTRAPAQDLHSKTPRWMYVVGGSTVALIVFCVAAYAAYAAYGQSTNTVSSSTTPQHHGFANSTQNVATSTQELFACTSLGSAKQTTIRATITAKTAHLVLSNGEQFSLPLYSANPNQTRYGKPLPANPQIFDGITILGSTLLLSTSSAPHSTLNCQRAVSESNLLNVYKDGILWGSIGYPQGYVATNTPITAVDNNKYTYIANAFLVSTSTVAGTNLSRKTSVGVEQISHSYEGRIAASCNAGLFPTLGQHAVFSTTTQNGVTYSVGMSTTTQGSEYTVQKIYALVSTNPCDAIAYHIVYHYPPTGNEKLFDESKLLALFDAVRKSFVP